MGGNFTLENSGTNVITKIHVTEPFSLNDLKTTLETLRLMLKMKKPFVFYAHFDVSASPYDLANMSLYLIRWLKDNEPAIVETLLASAIVINNSIIADIFTGIFKIKPTKKPNLITTNLAEAKKFVANHL
jgi:hypothetical protein